MMNYQTLAVCPVQSQTITGEIPVVSFPSPLSKEPELLRRIRKLLGWLKKAAVGTARFFDNLFLTPTQSAQHYNELVTQIEFRYGNPFGIR